MVAPSNETNIGTTVVITNKTPGPTGVERMVDGATDRMVDTLTAVDRMVVDTPTVTATTITTNGVAERSRTAGGRTLAPSGFRSNTSAKPRNPIQVRSRWRKKVSTPKNQPAESVFFRDESILRWLSLFRLIPFVVYKNTQHHHRQSIFHTYSS